MGKRAAGVRTLTTQQAARALGVSLPTVIQWANKGRFPVHRTPGGHRRILLADLVEFARAEQLPLPRELVLPDGALRALIVDDETDLASLMAEYLRAKAGIVVEVAGDAFEAGWMLARFQPDVALIDVSMPGLDALRLRALLRSDPATAHMRVLALTSRPEARLTASGYDGVLLTPVKLANVLMQVHRALGLEVPE